MNTIDVNHSPKSEESKLRDFFLACMIQFPQDLVSRYIESKLANEITLELLLQVLKRLSYARSRTDHRATDGEELQETYTKCISAIIDYCDATYNTLFPNFQNTDAK